MAPHSHSHPRNCHYKINCGSQHCMDPTSHSQNSIYFMVDSPPQISGPPIYCHRGSCPWVPLGKQKLGRRNLMHPDPPEFLRKILQLQHFLLMSLLRFPLFLPLHLSSQGPRLRSAVASTKVRCQTVLWFSLDLGNASQTLGTTFNRIQGEEDAPQHVLLNQTSRCEFQALDRAELTHLKAKELRTSSCQ